ncbi:MAG: alpha/beta hydrolase domain-containing protein [Telluria sp.]
MRLIFALVPLLALASCATPPPAARLDIVSRAPAYAGTVFEGGGAYETVTALAHTPRGDAEVVILRPVDAAKGSRVLVAEVVGGEGRLLPRMANDGDARLDRSDSAGNGFTMRRGHTIAWVSGAAMLGDVMALLKAELRPELTLAVGVGEGGRALRNLVRDGHNAGPGGSKVFDGAMPLMAGGGDAFPYTYGMAIDPASGKRGGILARCTATGTCPKLIHADSSNGFWQADAALVATGGTARDVDLPDNVRAYLMSSTQHVYADRPVPGECRHPNNPAQQSPVVRVMLDHLVAWARSGRQPPPSRFPMLGDAMLVNADRDSTGFPDLRALGIDHPEGIGKLVPMVDVDGHDIAGIRLPDIEVPLATHAGWNLLRSRTTPAPLCGPNGMFVPLAATPRAGDPRRAISQRYASRIAYAKAVAAAARDLRDKGLLLQEDVDRYIARAMRETRVP